MADRCFHCSCSTDLALQVEPHPKDFGKSLGAALDFNFQEHMGMLNQLVGLMGALPVHKEDSPQMTFKRWACSTAASLKTHSSPNDDDDIDSDNDDSDNDIDNDDNNDNDNDNDDNDSSE